MSGVDTKRLQISVDWRASALVLLLLPLMLSLGFWQLERAEEKRQLQALFQQRHDRGPVAIELLEASADLRYQPVSLRGEYINDKLIFLDNRIYRGQFGYEIITPFKLAGSDLVILINRGWLQGDVSRRTLPGINTVNNSVELIGEVYVQQGQMLALGKEQVMAWPRVVQSMDVSGLKDTFDARLFPYTVRINEFSPGHYQPNWVVVNIQPAKHTAYAVQWFAMSFTLLLIAFLANTNAWALIKTRQQ